MELGALSFQEVAVFRAQLLSRHARLEPLGDRGPGRRSPGRGDPEMPDKTKHGHVDNPARRLCWVDGAPLRTEE